MKKLSGKRYFYWLGQSEAKQGLPLRLKWSESSGWPKWAKTAYWHGWYNGYNSLKL